MRPRFVRPLAACALAAMLLTACGESGQDPEAASTAATAAPDAESSDEQRGTTLEVMVQGNDLSPKAEQVEVSVGEEVTLEITSDRDGEFHVHSTPEQVVPFGPGKTTAMLKFARPGLVDVEEHASHKLLVKFEVR